MSTEWTREELYTRVWKKPISAVAADLGTSVYLLIKHCRELGVPLPLRGHWSKLQFGKAPEPPPLPLDPPVVQEVSRTPGVHRLCERSRALLAILVSAKPNYEGLQTVEDKNFPRVKVTKEMIDEAALLFQKLLSAVESLGIPFRKSRSKYEGGYFEKGNDRLYLEITEPFSTQPGQPHWRQEKRIGKGELEVSLRSSAYRAEWRRSWPAAQHRGIRGLVSVVKQSVEDYYRDLELKRAEEAERRRLEHEQWLKQEAERKQREHAKALVNAQICRTSDLLIAAEWARVYRNVVDFINECESRWMKAHGTLSPGQQQWLSWARHEAEAWSPWSVGYPDPNVDGTFDSGQYPYPVPLPLTRRFIRPPTMPEVEVQQQTLWTDVHRFGSQLCRSVEPLSAANVREQRL